MAGKRFSLTLIVAVLCLGFLPATPTAADVGTDFNGDGRDDILWYGPGSAGDYVWYGTQSGFSSQPVTASGDYRPVAGDFDGNGFDDVLWYSPGSGADYLWSYSASGYSSRSVTINGDYQPMAGDFDGDGRDDLFWYAPGPAGDYVWYSRPSGFSSHAVTASGDYRPVAGDFDGNGFDDVLWYAPGSRADYLWSYSASGYSSRSVTINGDYQPMAGDFDGDGRDDLFWYAPGPAGDYVWYSRPSGSSSRSVTVSGTFRPVAGDFDGDDRDDIMWYAPGAAADYVWYGKSSGFSVKPVSVNGDYRPVGRFWPQSPSPTAAPTRPSHAGNPIRSLGPRQVALTFDDGPSIYTPQVLDILDRYGVPATFFVVGDRVTSGAALLQRAHRAGHSIQNHTWGHADLARLSDAAIASQLDRTSAAVQAVTGERPTCFRPPYGSENARVRSVAASRGLGPSVLWNVETSDYKRPSPVTIASSVLSAANGRGLIVLMHDGGGPRANTLAALPTIISGLQSRGYQFVTLCN